MCHHERLYQLILHQWGYIVTSYWKIYFAQLWFGNSEDIMYLIPFSKMEINRSWLKINIIRVDTFKAAIYLSLYVKFIKISMQDIGFNIMCYIHNDLSPCSRLKIILLPRCLTSIGWHACCSCKTISYGFRLPMQRYIRHSLYMENYHRWYYCYSARNSGKYKIMFIK